MGHRIETDGLPGGTSVTERASYSALPSDASDGQLGKALDTGDYYVFYKPSGGPGVWVEPWLYEAASAYVTNATGDAYAVGADDGAAMTARGFDLTDVTNDGTITKAASGPITVDSGTTGSARLTFTPTSFPTKSALMMKFSSVTGTLVNNTIVGAYDGSVQLRTSWSDGSAGGFSWRNGSSGAADKIGPLASLSADDWLMLDLDTSAAASVLEASIIGSRSRVSTQYNDMAAVANTYALVFCNSAVAQHVIEIDEFHWIAYS